VFPDLAAAAKGQAKPTLLVQGKETAQGVAVRPGTREVTFLRSAGAPAQLFALPITGGEARRVASTPPIAAYQWRPDGRAFAFTALDPVSQAREAAQAAGIKPVVVDEDWQHLSLWLWEEGAEKPRKLTEGRTVFAFEWAPDGKRLMLAAAPRNLVDDSYMFQRLHLLDLEKGSLTKLVDNPGKLGGGAWSPDGAQFAYISAADRNDPHAGMLYVVDVATRIVRALTPGLAGMIQEVEWAAPDRLTVLLSIGVAAAIAELDPATGRTLAVLAGGKAFSVAALAIDAKGRCAAVGSHAVHGSELFWAESPRSGGAWTRLTDTNPWLAGVALGEQSVHRIEARDGLEFEGILIEPVGREQGRRYPLVIVVHGGPEAHFSNGWLTSYGNWGQLLAARGIASWYPNYRASTGYGVEFCKKDHGDPMGYEMTDHLDAIDHFVAAGLVDRARVGIGGGSYGGYTAAFAATRHTEAFAAAVGFVPFTDLRTKWLTSDIPWEFFCVHYQEQWPWQQPGLMWDRSPLSWAHNCRTPLLLLGGTADPRVHPSQPFMLYRAVKYGTETPVRYVQYPGEGHGNRTNVYQLDYALRTLQWFEWYLLGDGDRRAKAMPAFELGYPLPQTARG
jgi:dipeptidyl aminopeptidase/acylaminoacyl peptidase